MSESEQDWRARLRSMLLANLERARALEPVEERLGGEHVPCLRSQQALLREIAEEMGVDLGEEQAP